MICQIDFPVYRTKSDYGTERPDLQPATDLLVTSLHLSIFDAGPSHITRQETRDVTVHYHRADPRHSLGLEQDCQL